MKKEVLAAAMAADLAVICGEVLASADLADLLKLSQNALRLELSRGGDVPRPAELPGKGHRWLTRDVAVWLAARSTASAEQNTDGVLGVQTRAAAAPRRAGRPRKQSGVGAEGVIHV